MIAQTDTWPELRYDAYSDTRDTLHMYSQIIGKIRLALTPPLAQWAHSPLLLAQDGFTTTPLWVGDGTMAAGLDLIRHEARFERSDGRRVALKLGAPVADFYSDARAALDELGVAVTINAVPQEIPEPIPFDQDTTHHVYDPEQANRLWQAMIRVGSVYEQYASGYWGKQTPPSFYWGGGDFGTTRYSGRPAMAPIGLPKIMTGSLDAEAATAELTFGNDAVPMPAFLAMAFPPPPGIESATVQPAAAKWAQAPGMPGGFMLPYDAVRTAEDPRGTLLSFLTSTYEAIADRGGWDRELLEQRPPQLIRQAA